MIRKNHYDQLLNQEQRKEEEKNKQRQNRKMFFFMFKPKRTSKYDLRMKNEKIRES